MKATIEVEYLVRSVTYTVRVNGIAVVENLRTPTLAESYVRAIMVALGSVGITDIERVADRSVS